MPGSVAMFLVALVVAGPLGSGQGARPSAALFTDVAAATAGLAADTLQPPSALTASGGSDVRLTWTPSPDAYADGYRIERAPSSGGPYAVIGTAGPTATGYTDPPPVDGAYWYVVRTLASSWVSPPAGPAGATATMGVTGFHPCSAQAYDSGGDGDGYEVSPANGCVVDGTVATDAKSGRGTSTSCASSAKDRHRFGSFGLGVPVTASSIQGISVRITIAVDDLTGTNAVCAELSWDGGASWTAPQSALLTSTALTAYALGGPTVP